MRYSTDLKKKVGLKPQRSAAHAPVRAPNSLRPSAYEPASAAANTGNMASRMNSRMRGSSPMNATRGALRTWNSGA